MPKRILLIEDNAARAERRRAGGEAMPVVVRLHIIENNDVVVLAESIYKSGSLKEKMSSRGAVALKLLDDAKPLPRGGLLVAGTAYGSNRGFLRAVLDRRLNAIVEIRPSLQVELLTASGSSFSKEPIKAMKLLQGARWRTMNVPMPQLGRNIPCRAAELGSIRVGIDGEVRLFAVDIGGIDGFHPGMMIGATTQKTTALHEVIRSLYWVRWIRPFVRRQQRRSHRAPTVAAGSAHANGKHRENLQFRSNIKLARLQDK